MQKAKENKKDENEEIVAIALMNTTDPLADRYPDNVWIADTGATRNMTYSNKYMINLRRIENEWVTNRDGTKIRAEECGDLVVHANTIDNKTIPMILTNVLVVPSIMCNLFSLNKLADISTLKFAADGAYMTIQDRTFEFKRYEINNLYSLDMKRVKNNEIANMVTTRVRNYLNESKKLAEKENKMIQESEENKLKEKKVKFKDIEDKKENKSDKTDKKEPLKWGGSLKNSSQKDEKIKMKFQDLHCKLGHPNANAS